ncbi:TPA: hypothetical protein N0F65_003462 [Lagenidium giganteum]|uniref:Uncharacterized protein n=1 Tax=Lagenidium giganteum TaxID=4803 RepID=A0AAV2YJQ7_9STRA|nr:TPA: hypothetical protein N0F65_003462 [Lagenidium giganteum]
MRAPQTPTMLKAKARPKPRKKSAKNEADASEPDNELSDAAGSVKQKAKRKRSATQKKKDVDGDDGEKETSKKRGSPQRKLLSQGMQLLQQAQIVDNRYERAPRLLPPITGVNSLSNTEVQHDLKQIQSALTAFEAKMALLMPQSTPGASSLSKDGMLDDAAYGAMSALMPKKRRTRPNGAITPEELVETLPTCRRAVRLTQRELQALKRERDDLERDFMRLRCKYIWQISEMRRLQKQQDRVLRVLGKDVAMKAKTLESSRRRTSALQDIMSELEARGSAIVRLTRENHQLRTLVAKHDLPPPEVDEIYIGDRVEGPFGVGVVEHMDDDTKILTLKMNIGGHAYVHEEDVEVLTPEISYLDAEKQLKQSLFDKIGALVEPNSTLGGMLSTSSSRRRTRGGDNELGTNDGDGEDDESEDNEHEDVDDGDDGEGDGADSEPRSKHVEATPAVQDVAPSGDTGARKKKRRKLMVPPATASSISAKKAKQTRLIDFTACKIPITPYDTGLLLSPLSDLPEKVSAVGPGALQWMASYLPEHMQEWEQERYDALQMKGEIERLRFRLQHAEAEKLDAQQHASDQLESINQLVAQLDKLRESTAEAENGCSNCSGGGKRNGGSRGSKAQSRSNGKQNKRARSESVDEEGSEKEQQQRNNDRNTQDQADEEEEDKETAAQPEDDDDAGESSDAASSTYSGSFTRSLRPRRKPTSGSTTATTTSPKK